MNVSIEPCPFCGEATFAERDTARNYLDIGPHGPEGLLHVCMDGFGWYWASCSNCYANGPRLKGPMNYQRDADKTRVAIIKAVDAWNMRAHSQGRLEL